MHWECRERFPRHRLQRKPLVSDLGMHHMPWGMSGSLTLDDGENVPGIPDACATRNFTYLARGPFQENWASMAANDLAPCATRSSTAAVFIMQNKWVIVFHERFSITCSLSVLISHKKWKQVFLRLKKNTKINSTQQPLMLVRLTSHVTRPFAGSQWAATWTIFRLTLTLLANTVTRDWKWNTTFHRFFVCNHCLKKTPKHKYRLLTRPAVNIAVN